ncbi:MAG TPA: FGGY-family carbohydrate kinase [Geminicoccus sp.]|jgi:xylulokinase|uniref:xylulokinase n=1 Tax=Geminicoccus sp. TaxID=2024832 RepID=UPI002E315363|nr:FGGY-family carbohydrate kinase [Geminicoccus sp.]HEX2527758.1 FGGY-family carbohydrate kinase [Geminicoccus sp.]
MTDPLVLGIDSSTTATKAIAWDQHGQVVVEGRARVPMSTPRPGYFEQGPQDWWASAVTAICQVTAAVDPDRIQALSIANQRETFAVLDADGNAVRPGILWLDERSGDDVRILAERHGIARIRQITGKTPDPTPAIYGLSWLQRNEPETLRRTAHVVEVHGYLVFRLTGQAATSRASADPLGVYDMEADRYADELLAPLGLGPDRFFTANRPGTVIGEVSAETAEATGLRAGTKVVAGGGDGQAGGLGCGVIETGRAYCNLGTATVSGVWASRYMVDPGWRTMSSVSGEGFINELCLRTGTYLTDWFVNNLFGLDGVADPQAYARLEAEAAALPVGSDGLLLTPWWLGSMTPYWDNDARGTMIGLSAEHGRGHFYRAKMEGIALEQALGIGKIEAALGTSVTEIVAIGGGSRSDLWCQILADSIGRPVLRSSTVEASSLGAGICAAMGAGWFGDMKSAVGSMAGRIERRIEPDAARHARYGELLALFERLYPQLRAIYADLAAFKQKGSRR